MTSLAAAASAQTLVPKGAIIGPSGYATISDTPPAPFTARAPGVASPPTSDQIEGQRQFARAGQFQNKVRAEVQALAHTLRKSEKGNFVDHYFDNEGEPRAVFRFKRNGRATLAKYTRNPRFVAETVRFSRAELDAAMNYVLATFREDRIILGGGTGSKRNRAEVEIAITEPEFRALVARKGVRIPEAVQLIFLAKQPASVINAPLRPPIAPLIRIFARQDRPLGALPDIASYAKIVLQDGCFRMPEQDNAHVLFPLGATLFIDAEGYLAFGPNRPGYARVGETVTVHGTIPEAVAEKEQIAAVRSACGPGKVVKISSPTSAAAERAQNVVDMNANVLRQFTETYGLSDAQARRALERCKAGNGGRCFENPIPPPPMALGGSCPAGTTVKFGMCRTREGYIRPIPEWLVELMKE